MVAPALSGAGATITGMWIAMHPDSRHRRVAFETREAAAGYAEQLSPPWQVKAVDDPDVPPITGRPPADTDQPAG
ncbi:hypothetical protein [Nakamurella multipartita]|uniref:Uncharacterized protein n=1 Tax=Nakamurella multipartita (strain ATCC 700099 / DSM 44233 / CIP 104796 / JCM 9543 / NBRC 105858 / Y-104) TaxID=479431 RepID=C8X8G6_NAKMY|nr:hypothetical protein [Nakamurella multipartita]ACV79021.1 hypothetical protein Namu_2675 [Nakamurella multipartita DSM 44233]